MQLPLSKTEARFVRALSSGKTVASLCQAYDIDELLGMQLACAASVIGDSNPVFRPVQTAADECRPAFDLTGTRLRAKLQSIASGEHFAILGLRRDASSFEVERAYQGLCLEYGEQWIPASIWKQFPDEISRVTTAFTSAYQLLRDRDTRRAYLENLEKR